MEWSPQPALGVPCAQVLERRGRSSPGTRSCPLNAGPLTGLREGRWPGAEPQEGSQRSWVFSSFLAALSSGGPERRGDIWNLGELKETPRRLCSFPGGPDTPFLYLVFMPPPHQVSAGRRALLVDLLFARQARALWEQRGRRTGAGGCGGHWPISLPVGAPRQDTQQ